PAVADRAVLHAAAHDEPFLHLPMYRAVFGSAAALAYWSHPEQHLVERTFAVASKPALVVGLGVDAGPGSAEDARRGLGLGDEPFVWCLGRVDDGKGGGLLAEAFTRYAQRRADAPRLVFAGPIVHAPPTHPKITVAGPVDEPTKWGLLR